MSEIVASLSRQENPKRHAEHALQLGTVGIRIPIPQASNTHTRMLTQSTALSSKSMAVIPEDSPHYVLFEACLGDARCTENEMKIKCQEMVDWIQQLDQSVSLEVLGVYQTESYVFLFTAPLAVWLRLKAISQLRVSGGHWKRYESSPSGQCMRTSSTAGERASSSRGHRGKLSGTER